MDDNSFRLLRVLIICACICIVVYFIFVSSASGNVSSDNDSSDIWRVDSIEQIMLPY